MAENTTQTCSMNQCPNPAVSEDQGRVGGWDVTIFYCHEHAREMREGTPVGPLGIDASKVRIDPVGAGEPATRPGRFPGIA
jgi:hypothetical protein